jgi:hypothetical protein
MLTCERHMLAALLQPCWALRLARLETGGTSIDHARQVVIAWRQAVLP